MILVLLSPRQRPLDVAAVLGGDCVVVTGGPTPPGVRDVIELGSYDTAAIVRAGLQLARRYPLRRVVSFAEADVLAAAELRAELCLPGQLPASATAYRDKARMRQCCDAAGMPGPRWAIVRDRQDVVGFVRRHGLPVVLKPRRGSGSVGVRVVRTAGDLRLLPESLPDHIVEEYVTGDPVHVDGLIVAGVPVFALPAEYTDGGCLAHWSDVGSGSLLIPRDDARHDRLVAALWDVVAALPPAPDLLLHAEFFVEPDRRPVLCEIASRLPGHPIPPMIDRALGVAVRDLWLRAAGGRPVELPAPPAGLVANFGLPPRRGTMVALPDSAPAPWVHDVQALAAPGEHWGATRYAARKSGDFVLTWTVTASDLPTLRARVADSARYFAESTTWELTGGRAA